MISYLKAYCMKKMLGFQKQNEHYELNEIEQMSESTNRDAGEATTDVLQAEQVDTFQPHVW